jgi:hypothetical protein
VTGRVNSITDDDCDHCEPCPGCARECWIDCYLWLNQSASLEDADEAFERFLFERDDELA